MGTRIYTFVKLGGEPYGCDSCDYPAPLQQFDRPPTGGSFVGAAPLWQLCEICATTHVSNHTHYTGIYPDVHHVTKTLAYCTNAILDQLGKFKGAPVVELPPDSV